MSTKTDAAGAQMHDLRTIFNAWRTNWHDHRTFLLRLAQICAAIVRNRAPRVGNRRRIVRFRAFRARNRGVFVRSRAISRESAAFSRFGLPPLPVRAPVATSVRALRYHVRFTI
jgi:hypothetical protein